MSLFARIALTGAVLVGLVAVLALAVWKPAAERSFLRRTESLLQSAEGDFETLGTSLVEETMRFSTAAALYADEQRALALSDFPFHVFVRKDGGLREARLRLALQRLVTDPARTGGEKHAAVQAELLDRARESVAGRLGRLRDLRAREAARHAELASRRTLLAWTGLLLLLLAGWAVALDRVVVRPVRRVTGAMQRFGAGERGLRLPRSGPAELAALAEAFNASVAAVERTERENAELRAGLEEKVRERTNALVRAARASTAGALAGGVAHEFNNLLGGILGCAEAALDERPAPQVREALEMIRKTAGRGVGITRALLSATRATPEPEPCDPGALVEEALAEVRPPPGIEVRRRIEPASLRADPLMLRQVLANLLRNAVEAMDGRGELRIAVRREGGEVVIEIADSGPGIDPSVADVLFEPFVTTRRGGREGAGLGLFLADRLVAAHGGRLEARNAAEGGAIFIVRLPA